MDLLYRTYSVLIFITHNNVVLRIHFEENRSADNTLKNIRLTGLRETKKENEKSKHKANAKAWICINLHYLKNDSKVPYFWD